MNKKAQIIKISEIKFKRPNTITNRSKLQKRMLAQSQLKLQVTPQTPKKVQQKRTLSSSIISNKIIKMKPFAVIYEAANVDKKLEQIYCLHKQNSAKKHVQSNTNIYTTKQRSFLEQNKRIISRIKKKSKSNKGMMMLDFRRIKTENNDADDAEEQIADYFISESKKEKKKYKQVKFNFQSFLQKAIKQGDFSFSSKNLKEIKGLKEIQQQQDVIRKYEDESEHYAEKSKNTRMQELNKNDIWLWIRSMKKVYPSELSCQVANKQTNVKLKKREIKKQYVRKMRKDAQKQEVDYKNDGLIKQKFRETYYNDLYLSKKK